MNPLTVRIFDEGHKRVNTRFLDMCTTTVKDAASAQGIFDKKDTVLSIHNIQWENCVGVGIDNASVNIGRHNSIMSRVHSVIPSAYFMGCPCHIAHNLAGAAADAFQSEVNFDIEELVIDIFYWFDKSTKRKSSLQEYCCFCDVQYRKIIKHISTRWLSLETAVERILKVYAGLRSYFLSESCSQQRLQDCKVSLMHQSLRSTSSFFNPFSQLLVILIDFCREKTHAFT